MPTIQIEIATVVIIAICIILSYLIPWLRSKAKGTNWERLLHIVETIVKAVEQIYFNKHGVSKDKFEKAMNDVKDELQKQHLKFDNDTITKAIEAAVLNLQKCEKTENK